MLASVECNVKKMKVAEMRCSNGCVGIFKEMIRNEAIQSKLRAMESEGEMV